MKLSIPKRDRIIIALALLIVFGATYSLLFVHDDQNYNASSEIVGEISSVSKDVRYKVRSRYDWRETHQKQKIALGDQIFTGKNSNAVVNFYNSQKLTILENSLIKFDSRPGEPLKIQVLAGEFKANLAKNQKIEIEICGEKHLVEAQEQGDLSIQNSKNCADVKVKSDQKNVKIVKNASALRQTASAKSNFINELNANLIESEKKYLARLEKEKEEALAKEKAEALAKELAAPLDIVELETPNKALKPSEKFSQINWKKVDRAQKYQVLVSTNNNFTAAESFETDKTSFAIPLHNSDKLFYKVKALSETAQSPDYSQPGLRYIHYPTLQLDKNEHRISYDAKTSNEPVRATQIDISWKPIPRITDYKLETSRDENFSSTDQVYSTEKNTYSLRLDQTGPTFYRVKAYNKDGLLVSQSKDIGRIEYTRNFDLLEPLISEESKQITLFFQKSDGQFIRLKWKNAQKDKASQYYIEISNSADFSKILYTLKAIKESMLIDYSLPVGRYYWRVKSFSNSVVSNWSQTATINILSTRKTASEPAK